MTELDFAQFGNDGWLEVIPAFQRNVIVELLAAGKTEEEIAELWLNRTGPDTNAGFGATGSLKTYFSNFRTEMDAFVCGDPRYATERAQFAAIWQKEGRTGIVALAAGCIAVKVGLSAVSILPAVALILRVVGKMGVNAYCSGKIGSSADKAARNPQTQADIFPDGE